MRLKYIVIGGIILLIILGPLGLLMIFGLILQIAIIYALYKLVRRLRR